MAGRSLARWRLIGCTGLGVCVVFAACEEPYTEPPRKHFDAVQLEIDAPTVVGECETFGVAATVIGHGGSVATGFDDHLAVYGSPGQLSPYILEVVGGVGTGVFRLGLVPQAEADLFVLAPSDRVERPLAERRLRVSDPAGYSLEEVADFGMRNLYAVWVDFSGFAVAGGEAGLIAERRDGVWEEVPSHISGDWFGATGFGPDEAYLVGGSGRVLLRDGGEWEIVPSGVQTQLHSADRGPGVEDDAWIVGIQGVVLRGRRRDFERVSFPAPDRTLRDVWAFRNDLVFVVSSEGWVYRWDGEQWTGWDTGVTTGLQGIWGVSETEVFATGGLGAIVRFDGQTWEQQPLTQEFAVPLRDVTAAGGDVITVGRNGVVLVERNGCWASVNPPLQRPDLRAVAAAGGVVFATGSSGLIYRLR